MIVSATSIDNYCWSVRRYLISKHGCSAADRMMYPLMWHINSGRASTPELKKLLSAKPFMVGRILAKGGSDDDTIRRVKRYIKADAQF